MAATTRGGGYDLAGALMASIFISYRREDTGGHAGRLFDRLTARFGDDPVFMDVQDIRPGQNFQTSIDETLARCDCVVVVIGPRWLSTVRERAALPEDFVRYEIAAALQRGIPVIPVLVGGARMPTAADLPDDLRPLSRRHAVEIRDERFEDDVQRLAEAVREASGAVVRHGRGRGLWLRAALGLALLTAAAAAVVTYAGRGADPVPIDGAWIAEMQKPGQRPYRVRFDFVSINDGITGTVQYPTGDGAVQDGELRDGRLAFRTTHLPQFAEGPATIRYQGEVTPDGIRLVATDDSGTATGMATRAASP